MKPLSLSALPRTANKVDERRSETSPGLANPSSLTKSLTLAAMSLGTPSCVST
jgi:hypothetical protein